MNRLQVNMNRPSQQRRAAASVEMALCLPALSALLLTGFTCASVAITHLDASMTARHQAWQGRHTPWEPSAQYTHKTLDLPSPPVAAGKILVAPSKLQTNEGLLESEVEQSFVPYLEVFREYSLAQRNHLVLGGSWDHQVVEFEGHAELAVDPRVTKFTTELAVLNVELRDQFSILGSAGAAIQAVNIDLGAQIAVLHEQRHEVERLLDAKRRLLASKKRERARLDSSEPRAALLDQEIRRLEREVDELEDSLSAIDSALGTLGSAQAGL